MEAARINHFGIYQEADSKKIPSPRVCCQDVYMSNKTRLNKINIFLPVNPILLNGFTLDHIDTVVNFINSTELAICNIIAKNEDSIVNIVGTMHIIRSACITSYPTNLFYSNYVALLLLRPLYSSVNKHYARNIIEFSKYDEFNKLSTVKKLLLISYTYNDGEFNDTGWGFFNTISIKPSFCLVNIDSDIIKNENSIGMWNSFGLKLASSKTELKTKEISKLLEEKKYEEIIDIFSKLW